MKVLHFSDPTNFHNADNPSLRSYATAATADAKAGAFLARFSDINASATVVVTQRTDGRFVGVIFFQGTDAMYAVCAAAQSGAGFMCFA